jgi:hypothetical protein
MNRGGGRSTAESTSPVVCRSAICARTTARWWQTTHWPTAACFRMRAERRPWAEVVGFAKESGEGRHDDPAWTHRSLSLLMKNRVYVGEARSGAYSLPGAHEPIVDRGIFELVQLARTATAQPSGRAALLAGLLRCSGCGKSMTSGAQRRRNGEHRPVYACGGRCVAGPCPRPVRLRGTEIEDHVQRAFFELYERSTVRRTASAASRRRAERDLGLAETTLAEYDWSYPKDSGDETTRRGLLEQIDVARARVSDLARSTLLESPARLHRRWPGLPVTERRRIMGLVMDAVLIRPDRGDGLGDQLLFVPFGMSGEGLPQPMRPAARVPYEWSRTRRTPFAVLGAEDPAPAFC